MSQDYNRSMQFPTNDNYVNRITGAEFTDSKRTGNPMIHYKAEVILPDTVDIGGKQVTVAGVETDQYLVTANMKADGTQDEDKTSESRERVSEFLSRVGVDVASFNWDNPDVNQLKGKVVLTAMGCDITPYRKDPTPEQKAAGQEGDIMINPLTNKPKIGYKPKIVEVWGLAPERVAGASKPY